jgi:hypothetical protein
VAGFEERIIPGRYYRGEDGGVDPPSGKDLPQPAFKTANGEASGPVFDQMSSIPESGGEGGISEIKGEDNILHGEMGMSVEQFLELVGPGTEDF